MYQKLFFYRCVNINKIYENQIFSGFSNCRESPTVMRFLFDMFTKLICLLLQIADNNLSTK